MKIVVALNYYAPYVSGLTNVARDVAEGLAERGHDVTVVTTRHRNDLPLEEIRNGVRVLRCPVALRIGKGVISPSLVSTIVREARDADVVNLHAPMLEAGAIVRRLAGRTPVAFTYQCDIDNGGGFVARLQARLMDASCRRAARGAAASVVSSADYAAHSRLADELALAQVVIPPGCMTRSGGAPTFRDGDGLHVGFLGRIVEEKGITYLVEGFSALQDPDARLLIAGDFGQVAGGSVIDQVRTAIGDDPRIRLLGFLPDEDVPDFYASIDAFALTSVNSFEAYGIVQIEGMIAGVPSIATDMPGVRQPVLSTGFGVIVPPRSPEAITDALEGLRTRSFDVVAMAADAEARYGQKTALDSYEQLFERLAR